VRQVGIGCFNHPTSGGVNDVLCRAEVDDAERRYGKGRQPTGIPHHRAIPDGEGFRFLRDSVIR
jgi:hypothetical protein